MIAHLRVLLPFSFDPNSDIATALHAVKLRGKAVWAKPERPHSLYLEEIHAPVTDAVFSPELGSYWQVCDVARGMMFPDDLRLRFAKAEGHLAIAANQKWGVELFLSNHGVGVLSIALDVQLGNEVRRGEVLLDAGAKVLATLYGCSQIGSVKSYSASLWRPHPSDDPGEWARRIAHDAAQKTPAPPVPDSPLEDRLGVMGGVWRIVELARWLLPFDHRSFDVDYALAVDRDSKKAHSGGQFGIYAVVRVGPDEAAAPFEKHGTTGDLLAKLVQLQEPDHPGGAIGDSGVAAALLNSRHVAASTSLAAVHIVADQPGSVDFNEQRPHNLMSKYFLPSLLAHYQRRYAELQVPRVASALARMSRGYEKPDKSGLKRASDDRGIMSMTHEIAAFEASFALSTVSSRHAVNRWFALCVEGEHADSRLAHLRDVVERLENAALWKGQDRTHRAVEQHMSTVAHVQQNIEWVELFIIAVYAIEATHIIGEAAHFNHSYILASLLVLPVLSAGVTFVFLILGSFDRPAQREHEGRTAPTGVSQRHESRSLWSSNQFRLLLTLLALYLVWFACGFMIGRGD